MDTKTPKSVQDFCSFIVIRSVWMRKRIKTIVTGLVLIICVIFVFSACNNLSSGNDASSDGTSNSGIDASPSKAIVLSDVHIAAERVFPKCRERLKNTLVYARDNDIDAIIFNGDTVNSATAENYGYLEGVFNDVFGSVAKEDRPIFIFGMGNHEFYPSDRCASEETEYDREVARFKEFVGKWAEPIEDNVYVRQVKGVNYVLAYPSAKETYAAPGGAFNRSDIDKIKAKFDAVIESGNDKPIVFITHWPLGETYGGEVKIGGEGKELLEGLLKDYPQVIHLTGHTHYTSLHERAFAQNDWTSINVGPYADGDYVSGIEADEQGRALRYDNITKERFNENDLVSKKISSAREHYFGLFFDFTDTQLNVGRMDFSEGVYYEHGSWNIPYGITKENKRDKFYYEDGERAGETLHFGDDTGFKAEIVNGEVVGVSFKDVDEYWACEGYEILVGDSEGNALKRVLWMSRFWAGLKEKSFYEVPLSGIEIKDEYTFRLRAIDFFGKYSEPCGDEIEIQQATETHPHKATFSPGTAFRKDFESKEYLTVTFDYKLQLGNKFYVALIGNNWSTNYYGYFCFDDNGETTDYSGVTCHKGEDGYVSVTINLDQATKMTGTAERVIKSFYIHPNDSNATVYLDNVFFNE